MKVLYITSNIPLPKLKNNRIILTIAEKLLHACDISVVFPSAVVIPPFSFMKKYRPLAHIKSWTDGCFTVHPLRYLRLPGKRLSYMLIDTVRPERYIHISGLPDLCHAHFIMPDGYIACRIKQKYGVPYAVSVRSSDMRHLTTLAGRGFVYDKFVTVLRNADRIIVHNRPQQEFIVRMGFDSVIIPHGVESSIFNITADKPCSLIISTVAKLIQQKNVDWVIRAVKRYAGRQSVKLLIAGDGVCRDELQQLAGNALNIHFLGKISHCEVLHLLNRSHIFALPSVNETFGLVYMEAAAMRNAVICHRGEGVDGIFENGKEIMLCEGYDEFENILNKLIENPDTVKTLADNGHAKAKSCTWEHIQSMYMEVYSQIIKSHSSQ